MGKNTAIMICTSLVLSFALLVSFTTTAQAWEPKSTIEIVAPAGPGGGWDMVARMVMNTLTKEKIVNEPIIVSNKPGGGGAVGWRYLNKFKGKGEYLACNSSLLILNNLLGRSELSYKDFTPLANLETEWEVVAVASTSPYKTGKEFFEALKKNPRSLPIGVGPTLGNDDHLQFLMLARRFGIKPKDINFVVYPGAGGEQIPALLGGHVKALTIGMGEVVEQVKAGNIRILGVSSDKRVELFPDVPTWKEQGIDLVFAHWRGVMGPGGMTQEQIAYWNKALGKMAETAFWKDSLAKMEQYPFYMDSKDYLRYLKEQNDEIGNLLKEIGMIK
jgi:putative tricarboxylic transport membrane protein